MTKDSLQLDMFDKPISEVRVVQVVNAKTEEDLSWNLEYRFVGEKKWYPVMVQRFKITMPETTNESEAGN